MYLDCKYSSWGKVYWAFILRCWWLHNYAVIPSFPTFISSVMDTIRLSNLGSIYTSLLGKETIGYSFSVARDVIVTLPSDYDKSKCIYWRGVRRVLPSGVRDVTILCFFDFEKSWYIQLWIGCGYPRSNVWNGFYWLLLLKWWIWH